MTYRVYHLGQEVGEHACYYPAEQQAKALSSAIVEYQGVRGQCVQVWPLAPLNKPEVIAYEPAPYL